MDLKVRYNFPVENPNPFDMTYKGNYFVFANGFSNLSKDISEFNFQAYEKYIPMGYKSIVVCYRLVLIDGTKTLAEWTFDDLVNIKAGRFNGEYMITTLKPVRQFRKDWNQYIESELVLNPNSPDTDSPFYTWDNLEDCKRYAAEIISGKDNYAIVSIKLESINWH